MRRNLLNKCLVCGLVMVFIVAAIIPAITAYSENKKLCSISLTEKNKSMEEYAGTSDEAEIDVSINRLCEAGFIEHVNTKWPYERYNSYVSEIRETENNEQALVVLKEYNIVPQDITLEKLEEKLEQLLGEKPLTRSLKELIEKKIGGSANWIHCWLTFIDAQLGGTIFPCLYSPYLLYVLFSYGSGQVKTRCGNAYGNIRLIMFVYVGITSGLDPIVDFDGCSFVGLCLYAGYAGA